MASSACIIADGAEFVDALHHLRRGHVLVKVGEGAHGCLIDGAFVRHSFDTLLKYRLIAEYDNPEGFPGVHYYRISDCGREFAEQAWAAWRSRPFWRRLLVRLTG